MSVNVSDKNKYVYDAFISYRHSEIDKFVAKELHKQLETFKIPGKIVKQYGKKKINRIFRDKDELPITSNLADPIMNALRVSEFLIVICSPRLNESLWCKREIENFIAMHGQERVLAVLVEGEPKDSFPPELLYRDRIITLDNGETQTIKELVEPLAADVRGKSKAEIKKHLKTEVLRLLASMIGCRYDDLRQRHKERKLHRILAVASLVGAVGIAFGTVSTIMALQIQKQKQQIDRQYWQALENNAIMTSEKALDALEEGDRIEAISLACDILPNDLIHQNIPYTPEAFFALTESLQPYASGDCIRPAFKIPADAQIEDIFLSDDGNKLCVRTKYNRIMVWDIVEEKKCADFMMSEADSLNTNERCVALAGSDKIAYAGKEEVLIFDASDYEYMSEPINRIDCSSYGTPREVLSNSEGTYIAVVFEDKICSFSLKDSAKMAEIDLPEGMRVTINDSFLYQNDTMFVCAETDDFLFGFTEIPEEEYRLEIYYVNLINGEILQTYTIPYGILAQADAGATSLFVAVNEETGSMKYDELIGSGYVYCLDIQTGELLWQQTMEDTFINSLVIPYKDYEGCLVESYAQITAFYANSGELIGNFTFSGSIVSIFPLVRPDSYVVYCRDGSRVTLRTIENLSVEVVGSFIPATDNMKDFVWGTDFMAGLPYSSKEVIVYKYYQDEQVKQLYEFEDSIDEIVVSRDGKYSAVCLSNHTVQICDNEKQQNIAQFVCENYFEAMHFTEDGDIQIIDGDGTYVYGVDGKKKGEIPFEEDFFYIETVSYDGKYAFGSTADSLCVIETASGKVVNSVKEESVDWNSQCDFAFSNSGDDCVILDRENGQCRVYSLENFQCIGQCDMNATYVKTIQFSEDDRYIYIIDEDGKVRRYGCNLELAGSVDNLNYITDAIYKKEINGQTKLIFEGINGAYIVDESDEYDSGMKVEQFIPLYCGVNEIRGEYYMADYDLVFTAPMYTYQEILGKAKQVCYDNSLWTAGS